MNNKYENKTISIPLFKLIFIILIIVLSIRIVFLFFNKSVSEAYASNDTTNSETQENDKTKVYTYTAENGKTYDMIGSLEIPSLDIKYPILSTTSEELLKVSLTKYWGGNPNEVGNLCILGHNFKDSKFFGNLLNIEKNAIIKVTDIDGNTLDYKVYETSIVEPEDTSCTSQLTDGHTEVTLITCYYENGNSYATKRFVVKARAN